MLCRRYIYVQDPNSGRPHVSFVAMDTPLRPGRVVRDRYSPPEYVRPMFIRGPKQREPIWPAVHAKRARYLSYMFQKTEYRAVKAVLCHSASSDYMGFPCSPPTTPRSCDHPSRRSWETAAQKFRVCLKKYHEHIMQTPHLAKIANDEVGCPAGQVDKKM